MEMLGLDTRLIELWLTAADDLDIRVTAPVERKDRAGSAFACEVFLPDFGSPTGAIVVGCKTERRFRHNLRNFEERLWVSVEARHPIYKYERKHLIDTLLD